MEARRNLDVAVTALLVGLAFAYVAFLFIQAAERVATEWVAAYRVVHAASPSPEKKDAQIEQLPANVKALAARHSEDWAVESTEARAWELFAELNDWDQVAKVLEVETGNS